MDNSPSRPEILCALAESKFPNPTPAELQLLSEVTSGKITRCGPTNNDDDAENDPQQGEHWKGCRSIRSEVIEWLCKEPDAAQYVHSDGVAIHAARIQGKVNLGSANIPFPLRFYRCLITDGMNLSNTQIPLVDLGGSVTSTIVADQLKLSGGLFLNRGFRASDEVRLSRSTIGTDLDCSGGNFTNSNQEGTAINARGAVVGGVVNFSDGFSARGEVRLVRADIKGDLNCAGGDFQASSENGYALNAYEVKVTGDVYLCACVTEDDDPWSKPFHAQGEVTLEHANIGNTLDCTGGHFDNMNAVGLNADRIRVTGSVLLSDYFIAQGAVVTEHATKAEEVAPGETSRFQATGEVRLIHADIGGDLDCRGGKFDATRSDGYALNAMRARVAGNIYLGALVQENEYLHQRPARFGGEVNLTHCNIGKDLDCSGGCIINEYGPALNADRINVAGSILFADYFTARGTVNTTTEIAGAEGPQGAISLAYATIQGDLFCEGSDLSNLSFTRTDAPLKAEAPWRGDALNAYRATVAGSVFFRFSIKVQGGVCLRSAEIKNNLEIGFATFLEGWFNAEGATIAGQLFWDKKAPPAALDLSRASVGAIFDNRTNWPARGKLNLDGFVYSRIGGGPTDSQSRLNWLGLQSLDFRPQPYQQLAKVLRDRGDSVGARRVLFAMENSRRKNGYLRRFAWLWQVILWWTIGYGYKPWYVFFASLVMVAVGSGVFWYGYQVGLVTPTDKDAYQAFEASAPGQHRYNLGFLISTDNTNLTSGAYLPGQQDYALPNYYQAFSAPVYSFDSLLPIINFGQKDHWTPNPSRGSTLCSCLTWLTTGWLLRLYLWVHTAIGWLLISLFGFGWARFVRSS